MSISNFLFGNKDQFKQMPTMNPQQQQALSSLLEQLGMMGGQGGSYSGAQDYLSKILGGDQGSFEQFAAPYKTQFQEQTLPTIAERFAGLGGPQGGGALSSSGFGQALGGAGAQFQSGLAGLYAQLQQHAAQQAFGQHNALAGLGLGARPFENTYQPGSTGVLGGLLSGFGQGIGSSAGMGLGGGLGSAFSRLFGQQNNAMT